MTMEHNGLPSLDVAAAWRLGKIEIIQPLDTYWGGSFLVATEEGEEFILKRRRSHRSPECEEHLLRFLFERGLPVAPPIRTVRDECKQEAGEDIFSLYPRLPGVAASGLLDVDSRARPRAMGRALAALHGALRDYRAPEELREMRVAQEVLGWAMPVVEKHDHEPGFEGLHAAMHHLAQGLLEIQGRLPRQPIHRDPNPSNFLFERSEVTGILDFDMILHGPRVFDLCYASTGILVENFDVPERRERWPRLLRALLEGYHGGNPLEDLERQSIPIILGAIQALFIGFSLASGDSHLARLNARALTWLDENETAVRAMVEGDLLV